MFNKFRDIDVAQRASYSTSFFGDIIHCSKVDMVEILGKPTVARTSFDDFNKTFNEWILTTDEGYNPGEIQVNPESAVVETYCV